VSFLKSNSTGLGSDAELLSIYKQTGSLEVLSSLYERYMDLVLGVCLKYLKDRELARDAVMNIYEEMVEKLKKHEVDNYKGWLHMVAKNHCLMYLRSPRNLKTKELQPEVMHLEENVHLNGVMEQEASFNRLELCLQSLVKEQETSIRLFYYEKKCYKEIAEVTGYDWNKVRSFIQNARRNLKICMEKNLNS
jgi:RNA polymerase sigma factor (sigma-70 family)